MGGMVIEFGTKLKMLTVFFDHGIINRKKNWLMCQSVGNRLDSFRYCNIIPGGVIIGICFECIVKCVKRGIGQSGNHMAVGKAHERKVSRVKMEITNRNRFLAVGLEAVEK